MENDINIAPPIQPEPIPIQPEQKTRLIILLVILGVVIGGYFVLAKFFNFWPFGSGSSIPILTPSSTSDNRLVGWQTYRNEKYGFEVKYPPNSTIRERIDLNYQSIRIQNYTENIYKTGLNPGEYYLEISISDHKLDHKIDEKCQQLLYNYKEVNFNGTVGYRGLSGGGGDPGGIRFALCIKKPEIDFYIQATENNVSGLTANIILDTFKFIEPVP